MDYLLACSCLLFLPLAIVTLVHLTTKLMEIYFVTYNDSGCIQSSFV
jgi:hypothetical protein